MLLELKMEDNELIAFKSISEFINNLAEIFSTSHHSLKLYSHLINKTTLSHTVAIKKNITIFREFCETNSEFLETKQVKDIVKPLIDYSPKAFINIKVIYTSADSETKEIIIRHLLLISAIVYPSGKAKNILKNAKTEPLLHMSSNNSAETNFIGNIINKLDSVVDKDTTPTEAVSKLLQSGVFTELISTMNEGMTNGDINLPGLMSSVQGMLSTFGGSGQSPFSALGLEKPSIDKGYDPMPDK